MTKPAAFFLLAFLSGCSMHMAESCKPRIGQTTKAQMRQMCGAPMNINRTVTEYGTREQWRYGGYPYRYIPATYYYFDDGVLAAIQN